MSTAPIRSICVYCGSSSSARDEYFEAARATARAIASRGISLVYGGSNIGLMGAVADTVLAAGGEVTGVIPHALVEKEVAHPGLTRQHVVESMHDRKALMVELADGFIALPGGFGTLDELFESLTWGQLRFHLKPIGLLNVSGYFDGLLSFCDRAVEDGFIHPAHRTMVLTATSPDELLDLMAAYHAPDAGKWWTRP
jgi:hypothetical protein